MSWLHAHKPSFFLNLCFTQNLDILAWRNNTCTFSFKFEEKCCDISILTSIVSGFVCVLSIKSCLFKVVPLEGAIFTQKSVTEANVLA